jgi:hypothetical protein
MIAASFVRSVLIIPINRVRKGAAAGRYPAFDRVIAEVELQKMPTAFRKYAECTTELLKRDGSTSKNKELRKAATEIRRNARDGCVFAFPPEWTTGMADPLRMRLLHWGAVGTEVGNLLG